MHQVVKITTTVNLIHTLSTSITKTSQGSARIKQDEQLLKQPMGNHPHLLNSRTGPQVTTFLEDHKITSVRRLAITSSERYEELVNLTGAPLSRADIDQLNLFKTWYTNYIHQNGLPSNEDIINKFTEKIWDEFCLAYLVHVHNQQAQVTQE